MSSSIDPAKLKVIDLRNELQSRGLDTKGNKAALVKRLKDALESELKQELPDTSIADTSTEDLDVSKTEEKSEKDAKPPAETPMEVDETKKPADKIKPEVKSPEKSKQEVKSLEKTKQDHKVEPKSPEKAKSDVKPIEKTVELKTPVKPKQEIKVQPKSPEKSKVAIKSTEKPKHEGKSPVKPQVKGETKSDNAESSIRPKSTEADKKVEENGEDQVEADKEPSEVKEENNEKEATSKTGESSEHKGEKRKRDSASPERSQRRRSRSPVREDEPVINNDNIQLNWYDSDLHLQVDKESFLSAKPLTEGAFGLAWAGIRASHGVSTGKVCYEVKITEELKWEDISKQIDRPRIDSRRHQKRDRDKRESERKSERSSRDDRKSEKGKSGKDDKEKSEKDKDKSDKDNKDKSEKDEKEKPENNDKSKKDDKEKSEPDDKEKSEKDDKEKTEDIKEEPEKGDIQKSDETVEKMDVTSTPGEDKPIEEKIEGKTEEQPMETDGAEGSKKLEDTEGESKTKDEKPHPEQKQEPEPIPTHLFRVGWSLLTSSLQLGEEKFSYAYESTGKFVTDKQFVDYGKSFGVGDVIGAFLAIDETYVTIRYTVNGEVQPVAATVLRSEFPEGNFALFPHILTRNCVFELNLGNKEEAWFAIPEEFKEYVFLSNAEEKIAGPNRPETRAECEVILMCGLPGSGKTHWVKEHIATNLEKRYTVLGNTSLLEKMTVSGEPLKSKYRGKWSMLIDKIQKCLNKLISLAALRRRNYIIDQTNVFPSAQRRKMRPFEGFKRRAVIIVVEDEEQARRQTLQEAQDGKGVPDSTILEMKAAMSLPEKGDWMDEVLFVGLEETEAKEQVKKYNTAGKDAGYGAEKRFRQDRWQSRRNDYQGKSYRERSYHNQRFESRGRWSNHRGRSGSGGGGGGWNRDRRDNREWRGSGRDHGGRDNRSMVNYSRNRDQGGGGGRGRTQGWSSGGGWGGHGWNQQTFGSSSYGNQHWGSSGSGGSGQWKYSQGGGYGGGGYGGGGGNWNYYGQYSQQQNWNSQGQQAYPSAGDMAVNVAVQGQYSYNSQEAWAQYAKHYAQQSQLAQKHAAAAAISKQ